MVRNCAPVKMETTFYDEQYQPLGGSLPLKRSLTLELNRPGAKRARTTVPVLSSPDLNMLKIGTPELEKLILSQSALVTPTPNSQLLFPPVPTEEQEQYARGFVEALDELRHSDSSQGPMPGLGGLPSLPSQEMLHLSHHNHNNNNHHAPTYTNLDQLPVSQSYQLNNGYPIQSEGIIIKDEPQTVPSIGSSPPMSPIDMDNQEKIKLERKRQRNRLAASKCRRRKLERISRLEDKVKQLKGENTELSSVMAKLKAHVCMLKKQVMDHVQSGCQIMQAPQTAVY